MTASPPTVPTHPEYDAQQRADYWQGVRDGQSRPQPEPDDYARFRDKDGKYRYARTFENAPYGWDWTAVELATKKLLGS